MNGIKGYISIREASYRWGVSERRVNQYCAEGRIPYCAEGRIPGASRFGRSWAIPENAEKPSDPRFQEQRRDPGRTST
ncbi:MAG: DNA-binding protein [Butyricicoccus sp.]